MPGFRISHLEDLQENEEQVFVSSFNEIHFNGEISEKTINALLKNFDAINKSLLYFEKETKTTLERIPILVWFASYGGDVDQALRAINYIVYSRRPIVFVSSSIVASAAAYIYLSTKKEYRYTTPYSYFLFHDFLINNPYLVGSKDIVSNLESNYKILKEIFEDEFIKKTKIKRKIIGKGAHKDLYISSKKAIEVGVSHKMFTGIESLFSDFGLNYSEFLSNAVEFLQIDIKEA